MKQTEVTPADPIRLVSFQDQIEKIRRIIIEEYAPDKIILFGSFARGEGDSKSDVDIVVVSDREKDLPRYKRGLEVRLKLAEVLVPKDILFYSSEPF